MLRDMKQIAFIASAILLLVLPQSQARDDAKLPATDQRAATVQTLNTPRSFPEVASKTEWEKRAREIREHVLVSCGLWPLPEKTPLQPKVFGRIERDGYTVEKVHIQTLPGFYLAGNLYRPRGKGDGPFPAILNPHGHWRKGRLEDQALGSIAARCINFARQGMIAFSYDMVGYNDTAQVNHKFASDPTNQLWNISLMGLQTWNSIRALDFLESLPEVDKSRLGCTGESGGGTQTFMLGAIDDRLAAQAPIVMVSHSMQGGCLCENAPGLRIDYSNMEIAAVPAPRPQILVAATGDWTKATMTVEGPALEKIYRLFNAPDKLRYAIFDYDHNYNQTSREAVYEWFGKWLLRHSSPSALKEQPYQKEPDEELKVWPDNKLPADALTEEQLIASLIERSKTQLHASNPKDKVALQPLWRHTLAVEIPEKGVVVEAGEVKKHDNYSISQLAFGRRGRGDRVEASLINPARDSFTWMVVLADPRGRKAFLGENGKLNGLAAEFLKQNCQVLLVDTFSADADAKTRDPFKNYFTTYNRTALQERVQDLITSCAFAQTHGKGRKVVLCGTGKAGLWALLAAPAANAVIADCAALDLESNAELMKPDLFTPGLRKLGFESAAAVAAPNPLLIHNMGNGFSTSLLKRSYTALQKEKGFRENSTALSDGEIVSWVVGLKR